MKIEAVEGGVRLWVKVVPNASRTRVAGLLGEALKVQVAQAPEGGKANRAVEGLLAELLGLGKGAVRVRAGETQARKIVEVRGLPIDAVREKLANSFPSRQ
jgi:uncharacterized protein YggU (UPF0235/DUF167 family)